MSAITAKASRKMKKYAVLTREPRCFLGSFDFSWEQRKLGELGTITTGNTPSTSIPDYYSDDGIVWVTPTDIWENITFESARKLSDLGQQVGRVVPKNTILVTCIASIGKNTMLGNTGSFNQQINGLTPNENKYDPYFLLTESALWSAKMKGSAAAGTMQIVNRTEFSELKTWLPSLIEQQAIGAFFKQLDHLITLHQRKCVFLFGFFQAFISMIFTASTFSWEQRKFDEVFDCTVPNNTLSRAELSYDEGTVLNVHYGDVLIKYGSVLDVQKDDIPRIPHRCREDFNGALLQDGDVIIADTAEDETTGKACEIGNLQGSAIVSGLHTMVCRPRNRMALGYLGYYLNSNAYHHQLLPLMQGIKVLSLSRSNIQKTSVSYPIAVKEQQLIAYYFSQLDNLITLHQRECISFTARAGRRILTANKKRNTSSWEQRKLGELGTITTGNTPSTSIPDYYSDDGIVWVTPTDIWENITFESARKLSDLGQQVGRVVPKNTILVTCIASIGKNTMLGNTGSFNQQINGLTPNENKYDPYFLLTESALWSAKMKGSAAAGTMQIVNRTEFSEFACV